MTDKTALQKALEEFGYDCQSYSGRGMYGKRCLSFTTDDSIMGIGFCIGKSDYADEIREHTLDSMRWDNMGLSTVYYFPDVEYVGEDKEDVDHEDDDHED